MPAHVDVLEQQDSLKRSLAASLVAHAFLFSSMAVYSSLGAQGHILWGTPRSLGGGGSVAITPVRQIPLPARSGVVNPVANDTQSRVPAPPKPEARKAVRTPEPDAIEIRGRKTERPPSRIASNRSTYQPPTPAKPNQLYSQAGQALTSPMFGAQTGTGGVGVGQGSAFGARFGWYRDLLERRIAQKWRTDEVDPRIQTAPVVIVTFDILRNGDVRNLAVMQSSGNRALDLSAQRAIYDARPFEPLPRDYDRDSATIEIWFQLKR